MKIILHGGKHDGEIIQREDFYKPGDSVFMPPDETSLDGQEYVLTDESNGLALIARIKKAD